MVAAMSTTTATTTAAHHTVGALEAIGVRTAFGLPGVHNLPLWDALRGSSIDLVGVRHEQTAVYAADGHARTTGELGVAITTTGPGAANALGATGEAWASGSPVLVVATDIPAALRRPGAYRGVLHETRDQAGMFAPVVKKTFRVADAAGMAETIVAAAAHALAAPTGPVYVEIPTDFLSHAVPGGDGGPAPSLPEPARPTADADAVTRAAALLDGAERPLLWVGGGAARSGAGELIAALATRLGAPTIETYMGRGLMPLDHPQRVGLPPHLPEAGRLWDEADVVLAVGTDFDGMMTQNWGLPAPRALVAVNVDAAEATKAYPADVVLTGDARAVLQQLADALGGARNPAAPATATVETLAATRAATVARLRDEDPDALALLDDLAAAVPADTVVAADMCIPGYWIAALREFDGARRLAYPVGWGTLGFAFPASIGAAVAHAKQVLCVCGDGGFLFACGELAVLAERRPPLTVLIVDDGGYGMLRYDQRHADQEPFGVDLVTPDFIALARSFGLPAKRVGGIGAPLRAALTAAMASSGPRVLVLDAALRPPPTTSPRWYRRGPLPGPDQSGE
jgi:acetolactate synthase-1/2/3 large subunit